MQRHFDQDFNALKEQILEMGFAVEKAIDHAIKGLLNEKGDRKFEDFNQVQAFEEKINRFHMEIDDHCLRILAKQAPLASNLRLVLATVKINADLERMGDQAVNIAHSARHLFSAFNGKLPADLLIMTQEVKSMVRKALDAFVRQDTELAHAVVMHDDVVDGLKQQVFQQMIKQMSADVTTVQQSMDLILISRNLERLGDHATNIAEDVIFVVSGVDIRHSPRQSVS